MASKGRPPSILVFMTDHQRADTIRPEHPCRTPHMTGVAERGMLFTQHYTCAAHCCPSRATFMTGLYPSRHGVHNNVSNPVRLSPGLAEGVRCFSEDLRDAGYRLAYAGKWHVSDREDPGDRGWEELEFDCGKGTVHHASYEHFDQVAQEQQADLPREPGVIWRPGWGHYRLYGATPDAGPKGYENLHDYRIVRSAMDALPHLAAGDQPWMLYCGVHGPHDPYVIPEKYARMYHPSEVELPPSFEDDLEDKPRIYQRMRRMAWGQLSRDEVRAAIAHFWGYCTMLDAMFGELLEALEATGQRDNTVVVVTSDHGDYCGDHGLFAKGVPAFEGAYHVPLAIQGPPEVVGAGHSVAAFTSHADLAQTFRDLAGCPVPEDLPGRSLAPFLRGESPADWRDEMQFQFNGVELYYSQRTCLTHRWKYVYNGFDFDELYDLQADPHELVNLAYPGRYPQPPLHVGEAASSGSFRPWPQLPEELERVREEMLRRLWRFNRQERDMLFNPYVTVAMAPVGPGG